MIPKKFGPKLVLTIATVASVATLFAADEHKEGYKDTPLIPGTQWHVHDSDRPVPRVITPGAKFSQMADAPSDAVILFDGKDLSKWSGRKGEADWKIEDGYMEGVGGNIRTKEEFGNFQLHIEWATPAKVESKSQGRGNNGVLIFGHYEIQVLDSYNNPTYPDGQAGAIYGQKPPLVNASRGPGEWQTYDITFEAPQFDDSGKLTKKAFVTVIHNGVVIHNHQEILGATAHRALGTYEGAKSKGPLELYYHNNAVRFRNIWIRSLGEYDKP